MDSTELYARVYAGTWAFARWVAQGEGSHVHELSGLTASVVPSCPERSVVNSVGYDDPAALAEAHQELVALYEGAGIHAWTVWVREDDREAAELLARSGHVLDASPAAMAAPLSDIEPPADVPEGWERTDDVALLASINDRAYGYDGSFERALAGIESDLRIYVARLGEEAASCLAVIDEGEDCHVTLVATLPEARGRGLAYGLMAQALGEARERGLMSTSLVATRLGAPVYERLGYCTVGAVQMWERRTAA